VSCMGGSSRTARGAPRARRSARAVTSRWRRRHGRAARGDRGPERRRRQDAGVGGRPGGVAAERPRRRRVQEGPGLHRCGLVVRAAGAPCRNLDLFLMPPDAIRRSVAAGAGRGAVAVIEGTAGCSTAWTRGAPSAPPSWPSSSALPSCSCGLHQGDQDRGGGGAGVPATRPRGHDRRRASSTGWRGRHESVLGRPCGRSAARRLEPCPGSTTIRSRAALLGLVPREHTGLTRPWPRRPASRRST
jgi:hypothetical protein